MVQFNYAGVFGLQGAEAKNFNALLEKQNISNPSQYSFFWSNDNDAKFNDGEILNLLSYGKNGRPQLASIYNVKPGDTLSEIAKEFTFSTAEIKKANGMKTDELKDNMFLVLPFPEPEDVDVKNKRWVQDDNDSVGYYLDVPQK